MERGPFLVIAVPEVDPERACAALRAEGPVFHADVSRGVSVVGPLVDEGPLTRGTWRVLAEDALSAPGVADVAFHPVRVGWFSYEAGAWMDDVAVDARPAPLPEGWLGRCDAFLVREPGGARVVGRPEAAVALAERLRAGAPELPPARPPTGRPVPVEDRARFEAGVRRVRAHLRAGDCYQVNLARRLEVEDAGDPFDAWRRLRARNPARRAMFVETPRGAVVSNSPELLLSVRGGTARSVPIKGTAPRGESPEPLRRSAKERAELTMIVDLVRADLGRVAAPGTVVTGPRRVGGVGHVWHAMQEVRCRLADGRSAADAFAAVFPAGSVTGAPRIRATEIIRDLEDSARGVYCGALGWFGADGTAWWNVAIRTITFSPGGRASFHVGAGIVLGSRPEREYEETELKAARLRGALC